MWSIWTAAWLCLQPQTCSNKHPAHTALNQNTNNMWENLQVTSSLLSKGLWISFQRVCGFLSPSKTIILRLGLKCKHEYFISFSLTSLSMLETRNLLSQLCFHPPFLPVIKINAVNVNSLIKTKPKSCSYRWHYTPGTPQPCLSCSG